MSGHRNFTTAIAVLLLAAPLRAQSVSADATIQNLAPLTAPVVVVEPASAAARSPSTGPTRASASVGVHAVAAPVAALASPPRSSSDRSPAMMIVGGAALLVGAIIGGKAGTVVMIGGGIIGLVGLWNYLQ